MKTAEDAEDAEGFWVIWKSEVYRLCLSAETFDTLVTGIRRLRDYDFGYA